MEILLAMQRTFQQLFSLDSFGHTLLMEWDGCVTFICLICFGRGLLSLTLQCNLLNIVQHDTSSALKCISCSLSGTCPNKGGGGALTSFSTSMLFGAYAASEVCFCLLCFTSATVECSVLLRHIVSVWHNAYVGGLISWLGHVRDK